METSRPGAKAIKVRCGCGRRLSYPSSHVGKPAACPSCKRTLRVVAHAGDPDVDALHGSLVIQYGPQRLGEQIFLAGNSPIEVGKLTGKDLLLHGELVSRNHCVLVPDETGWIAQDQKSKNGLWVNGQRITSHVLRDGDRLRIGDYEFTYVGPSAASAQGQGTSPGSTGTTLSAAMDRDTHTAPLPSPAEQDQSSLTSEALDYLLPPPHRRRESSSGLVETGTVADGELGTDTDGSLGPVCPSCGTQLPKGSKICVPCGVDLKTGRSLITSEETNLDEVYIAAESVIRVISWIMWLGFFPIASEAFGKRKPHTTRAIAVLTVLVSAWFLAYEWSGSPQMRTMKNLMLWAGNAEPSPNQLLFFYEFTNYGDTQAFERNVRGVMELEPNLSRKEAILTAHKALRTDQQVQGQYHWSQLITHALLHGGIIHLASNMIFLLVFGSRVNALIGNLPTAILYPLLAIASGLAQAASMAGDPPSPMLGASGPVMGLAGLYLVLFPIHQVPMAFWYRWGIFGGFQLSLKLWAVRGFWVVLFYIGFDVFYTAMGIKDDTAHWAHLGGFGIGMAIGFILLLTRLVNAHGGDLISVMLGKTAWSLVGRPNRDDGPLQKLP